MSKYSVCRIETAKQQALEGKRQVRSERKPSMLADWTPRDEARLMEIIKSLPFKTQTFKVPHLKTDGSFSYEHQRT